MRTARLEYPSGRELLRDYWGYLASGGLMVGERAVGAGIADGDAILLEVRIASLRKEYRVAGRVWRRGDGRAVIAFEAGQAPDLLNAAWADGQGVPERRHRRWTVSGRVRYRVADCDGFGELVNVSRGGCCLETEAAVRGGARIVVEIAGERVEGRVRWTGGRSRVVGVEFERFQTELVARLVDGDVRHIAEDQGDFAAPASVVAAAVP